MSGTVVGPELERVSTGSPTLDEILHGGLPSASLTVLAGAPGTGKTVLALQMMFGLARSGKRCIYFTTLSEPSLKILRYMQLFRFFDANVIDKRMWIIDVGSDLREQGQVAALDRVKQEIERLEPDFVTIDSFRAIHDFPAVSAATRSFVYDLAVHAAGWGATSLLVGEYSNADVDVLPEFSIADGVIRLTCEHQELMLVRGLEVIKLRGSAYKTGRHFFDVDAGGFTVYPRVSVPQEVELPKGQASHRVSTGVRGLDDLLGGGLPSGSTTLIQGGTGTGKTILALNFLAEGARKNEPSIFFALEETRSQIRSLAEGFGWNFRDLESRDVLRIRYTSPVELLTDRFLYRIREEVASAGARRVALDSFTALALGVPSERRFRELVYALCKHMRIQGVTFVTTMEITELLGTSQLTGHGVSSITDNVVLLRYVEVGGHLERAISVLKARGIAHSSELRRLTISNNGPDMDATFTDLRAVLTGVPVPSRNPDV